MLQVKRYGADSEKKLLDKPDVNKYVFCQVLADCGQVWLWLVACLLELMLPAWAP